jgi:hypothetical protein
VIKITFRESSATPDRLGKSAGVSKTKPGGTSDCTEEKLSNGKRLFAIHVVLVAALSETIWPE